MPSNRDATQQVSDESPPLPDGWPTRGRLIPAKGLVTHIHRAKWPTDYVAVDLPQREHSGVRAGQVTGSAEQPVLVVPVTWMRRLAEIVGRPLADLVRGKLEDER